ncbi:ATP-binding protein [Candidatus Woesearchaeota archaeon]|nr:ATP-binding protein [Candidatus Woesearchaeota archaeon]
MDTSIIVEVLQKWNPWQKPLDAGIPRPNYLNWIYPFIDNKEVLILQGIRRSGKSMILRQLIQELISQGTNPLQILYLNLEDYNFAPHLKVDLLEEILKTYQKHTKNREKVYMFIDEVQKIKGWETWIRTYYDRQEKIKFVVTGSSSELMLRESSTVMTGRNLTFIVRPLSFSEFCSFSSTGTLQEYLEFGGFPEVVLQPSEFKKRTLLQQYLTDIIYKDVVDRHDIRNTKQLMEIATYLISAAGGKVSISKLARIFGISQKAVSLYVSYLIEAYLLYEVSWFSYSLKTRHDVTKLPKLYVLDNGLINVVSVKYMKNRGQMFENTVLIHLAARYPDVHYWSSARNEVDFIVEKTAINVTATDEIPEREQEGLKEFLKKHKAFTPLLITASTSGKNMLPLKEFIQKPF